jgi:hypothetical protein
MSKRIRRCIRHPPKRARDIKAMRPVFVFLSASKDYSIKQ